MMAKLARPSPSSFRASEYSRILPHLDPIEISDADYY